MPSRQDAIDAAMDAAKTQKEFVQDMRKEVFPVLFSIKDIIKRGKTKGIKIKVTKLWPLCVDISINKERFR